MDRIDFDDKKNAPTQPAESLDQRTVQTRPSGYYALNLNRSYTYVHTPTLNNKIDRVVWFLWHKLSQMVVKKKPRRLSKKRHYHYKTPRSKPSPKTLG